MSFSAIVLTFSYGNFIILRKGIEKLNGGLLFTPILCMLVIVEENVQLKNPAKLYKQKNTGYSVPHQIPSISVIIFPHSP